MHVLQLVDELALQHIYICGGGCVWFDRIVEEAWIQCIEVKQVFGDPRMDETSLSAALMNFRNF